ncbi:MAG: phosphatidate cytidylyltransferase [Rhodoferax sp.]|nr:phosphatidate cytidylyltransferase [Rhodoferax sp.]
MLKQRVITALLLLAVLLPAMFYPNPVVFCVVSAVLVAAGVWEWVRLNQGKGRTAVLAALLMFGLCCALLWWPVPPTAQRAFWLGATAIWVSGASWLLAAGAAHWLGIPRALRLIVGFVLIGVAWLAVAQARVVGINFMVSMLALVWVADIGAYFSGRFLGGRCFKRKLAPTISPGKTWEGVVGGLLGVVVCATVWIQVEQHMVLGAPSLYSVLLGHGWAFAGLALIFLTAWSVVGDLVESLIKRSAGVKDSSQLLPGHGGVLDRLDALLPVIPMALMMQSL